MEEKSEETYQKIIRLLEHCQGQNLQLASHLMAGVGYPPNLLQRLVSTVAMQYLVDFMPAMDYHRFGCSVLDRLTYELIYRRLNEFLEVPGLEVEVCAEYVALVAYVQSPQRIIKIESQFEELPYSLFYSIRASFLIGQLPPG
ncbi:MAG: hypothetical protein OHK0053_06830 [Microscillaceae bacterium]